MASPLERTLDNAVAKEQPVHYHIDESIRFLHDQIHLLEKFANEFTGGLREEKDVSSNKEPKSFPMGPYLRQLPDILTDFSSRIRGVRDALHDSTGI